MSKVFNTRLQLKYDLWENWQSNNPVLLAGEIAVVSIPEKADETGKVTQKPSIVFKVGDGKSNFNALPWASGLAADVYEWAKKEQGAAEDIKVLTEGHAFNGQTVTAALKSLNDQLGALIGGGSNGGSIQDLINSSINGLDVEDTAVDGQYVSAVSEVDGKIVVTRAALPTYTLTTGDNNGTVKFNGAEVKVAGLKSAAYAETTAFDAAGTGASEAAKVLGADTDIAGATTVHGALKAAAAAQDKADAAYVLPEGGIEADLSASVKESLALANSALQNHQDISHLATKETVNGIDERLADVEEAAATHATKTELTDGLATKADKDAFEEVQTTVNNFFSKDAVVNDTIDTLKEIANYIATDKEGAADITARVGTLESKVDVEKVSTAIATAKGEATKYTDDKIAAEVIARDAAIAAAEGRAAADATTKANAAQAAAEATAAADATTKANAAQAAAEATASADATTKANAAEANAKAYTDEKVGALHTVATTGNIKDLAQTENEYVIFYCGNASTMVGTDADAIPAPSAPSAE